MIALISDVHANLEALRAVLDDIAAHRVTDIICLGDTVGYGPDPLACIDLVQQRCRLSILGNHDQLALFDPEGWSHTGETHHLWLRGVLDAATTDPADRERRIAFLGGLPRTHADHGWQFVHGSARNPTNEYVFPEDTYNARKMTRIFALIGSVCFCGHTHVPGVMTAGGPEGPWDWRMHDDFKKAAFAHRPGGPKLIVNVGSVGQPRDGDPRACYVLWDGRAVRFRRVPYDARETARKITAQPRLQNFLGERLLEGR